VWRGGAFGCSFRAGTIFALQPGGPRGVIAIGPGGRAGRFASLPGALVPTGITFDTTGHFGHALLVTARGRAATAVLAIDCTGRVRVVTAHAPAMEGGIAVAPASFGRYGGDLVAAGETGGRILAVAPDGAVGHTGCLRPAPRTRYRRGKHRLRAAWVRRPRRGLPRRPLDPG
jgi:hypothetical protein